ncbi:hypothetical protein [Reichenbachiella agariperforans]|uniref:hypothetical protein n=1 Tax=Reichenbachiella agariperforans TaxID=156994 RepID=UPI001C091783|nr:hypothetical protein [Reichenbachiella agariperforans]MBU2912933.1 hypothetical protein [Reichenbachiella agariperforans]
MNWTNWKELPSPEQCRGIEAPNGAGIYQLRNKKTDELVLFGISVTCRKRMKSLYPKPYGTGTRNNSGKREYVLNNWQNIQYRTLSTSDRDEAKRIEDEIKQKDNHIFNT